MSATIVIQISKLVILLRTLIHVNNFVTSPINVIDQIAGMITKTEIKLLDQVNTPHGKWWVPFVWSCNLVRAARRQGRISDNYLMKALLDVCTIFEFTVQLSFCFLVISRLMDCCLDMLIIVMCGSEVAKQNIVFGPVHLCVCACVYALTKQVLIRN